MKNISLFLLFIAIASVSCNKEPDMVTSQVEFLAIETNMSGNKENLRTTYDIQINSKVTHDYYLTVLAGEETFMNNGGRFSRRFDGDLGIEWELASYFNSRNDNDSVIGIPVYAKKLSLTENMVLNEHLEFAFPPLTGDPEIFKFKMASVFFSLDPVSEEFEKLFLDNFINGDMIFRDIITHRQLLRDYAILKEQFPENPVRALIMSNRFLTYCEYAWINYDTYFLKALGIIVTTPSQPIFYPAIDKIYCYEEDIYGNMKLLD